MGLYAAKRLLAEREAIQLTALISASEDWSPLYDKTPDQHADLIEAEAELQMILTRFFRNMQKKAHELINWQNYNFQLAKNMQLLGTDRLDFNVDVVVNDDQLDQSEGQVIKITLQTVNKMVNAGFAASEILAGIPVGVPSTSALIQKLSTEQVAKLVGKKVLDDGSIVDNPNAEYNIMDTVRDDIAQSIKTSLGLGETVQEATGRVARVINPIQRAELIARTESVNAYNAGVTEYGKQSGAVGKQWMTAGAKDMCATYAAEGPVPFDYLYGGSIDGPAAHPNCRCAKRLIHADEWDRLHP